MTSAYASMLTLPFVSIRLDAPGIFVDCPHSNTLRILHGTSPSSGARYPD